MASKHQIEIALTDKQPSHSAPYRSGHPAQDLPKQGINKIWAMDVIERSQTEWALPIEFAGKKEVSQWLFRDYRAWMAWPTRNLSLIKCMHKCIDSLVGALILSTLHARSKNWQEEVADEDHDKTTFASNQELLRYTRSLFGLTKPFRCSDVR